MAPHSSPDPRQAAVLEHRSGPLLVLGAAGTGKTQVLRDRFVRLLEGGADPERTVLVVGSRRAREDARSALLERLEGSLPDLQVVTIHGLALRILSARHPRLGYAEPPAVLSAADQFARVQELLQDQDPAAWPAYGHLLPLRGFADQVRQFSLRAQESMLTPDAIEERAAAAGLTGWAELARFMRSYQDGLDDLNQVDFAALLQRAAAVADPDGGDALIDHLLVDDYQDVTLAAETIVERLGAPDLVVAGDPDAHVFSFQGTTDVPIHRFAERTGAGTILLETDHRRSSPPSVEAWIAPHPSEEHAAVARELRRLHIEEGVDWRELAVIVRRQGPHLGGLLRALDDARVPRAVPEHGLSLAAEPATFPYVLALRWVVADAEGRAALVESVLTSDLVGLSPAAARGVLRASRASGTPDAVLEHGEGLTAEESASLHVVRDVLARAEAVADRSVDAAFRILWTELPASARLVSAAERSVDARRELDAVLTFAQVVAEAGATADPSTRAFLESLDASEHGPGHDPRERTRPDAVQVLTAHGAVGMEFDTVLVAGAVEGNFPSLSRPEPMFDLAALDGPIARSDRNRARLQDERRLFRTVVARARHRVVLCASDAHADDQERAIRTRFAGELGIAWTSIPAGPFDEPVSVREAEATWRRTLADPGEPPALRLAAIEGIVALGVDPARWWFQRDWTDTGAPLHDGLRVSYSKLTTLENCELQYVLAAELGLGRPVGYHAWVGTVVHRIVEDCETGRLPRSLDALVAEVDARWSPEVFPARAISETWRRLAKERMLPNWWARFADHPATGTERHFEFEFDGATVNGYIDRIGPDPLGYGMRITDYKTGSADFAPRANESLQLGIYYLAALLSDDVADIGAITGVELAFLKGDWRTGELVMREWEVGSGEREQEYQRAMRERLSALIGELRRLDDTRVYRPNPQADCFFCEFRTLCSLYPEGAPVLHETAAAPAPAPAEVA
ncbi:MAG: ATP-dependent DNA helicase [Actinomycetota bacterium]